MKKINHLIFKFFFITLFLITPSVSCLATISSEPQYYTIPIKLIEGSVFINVEIEGKVSAFDFDSGSNTPIILPNKIVKKITSLHHTGKREKYTDVTGKVYEQDIFILKKARSGNYTAKNIGARKYQSWGAYFPSEEEGKIERHENKDQLEKGVIGFNFFQVDELVIDYPNKKLIASKHGLLPNSYSKDKCYSTPLFTDENSLVAEATYGNKKGKFLLDTGSTGSMLKEKIALNQKNKVTKQFSIGGGLLSPITFWVVDFSEPPVDGILGYDFFLKNRVHIKFHKKIVTVCPLVF